MRPVVLAAWRARRAAITPPATMPSRSGHNLLRRRAGGDQQRNAARRAWRDALERGGGELRKRMDAAGTRRKKLRLVDNDQVAYDSAKDLSEQQTEQRPDLDDFDRRLRDATDGK